jgi:hypothetical protein
MPLSTLLGIFIPPVGFIIAIIVVYFLTPEEDE